MKRGIILALLFLGVTFVTLGVENIALAEQFTLKAAHYFTADHPWNKGLEYFSKEVSEKSNGRIKIKIFSGGVLGSEPDMLQAAREGVLDFVVSDPSAASTFAREMDFFVLPFLFRDYEHWRKSLDGDVGMEYAQIVEEKAGLKILSYWGGSTRNLLSRTKPVRNIEDLRGFKLRLIASPIKMEVWKAVGAIPTPIPYLETYSALQAGVVDGMENESVAVLQMRFYEPAPFITRTEHEFTVRPLFMSLQCYNSLSEDLREVVVTAGKRAALYEQEVENKATIEAETTMMEKYNVKFFDIDKKPFMQLTAPVLEKFADDMNLLSLLNKTKEAQ